MGVWVWVDVGERERERMQAELQFHKLQTISSNGESSFNLVLMNTMQE